MVKTSESITQRWVSVRHVRHAIAHGQASGLDMNEQINEFGLAWTQQADAEAMVSVAAIEALFAGMMQRQGDPLIGLHLGRDIHPAVLGPLGHISQACNTLGEVLDAGVRYNGLLSNIGATSLRHGPGIVQVCWECSVGSESFKRQAREYVLAGIVALSRLLLPGREDLLLHVTFAHAAPHTPRLLSEYFDFFRCPVYFGEPVSALTLPAILLKTKMPQGDALVKELMEHHAQSILRSRQTQDRSLVDDVVHLLHAMIRSQTASRAGVAAQFGLSERTLHRKLLAQGSSFQRLLDRVRLDLADECLRDESCTVSVLAERLGFSTYQAFLRWFRQHTGVTPAAYRKAPHCLPSPANSTESTPDRA